MFTAKIIRNVLVDLAGHITRQTFTGHHRHYMPERRWHDDAGLDSIQIMELAAYANTLFHIYETDKRNYLLEDDQIDNWVKKIIDARKEKNERLTFKSSGTSGISKFTTHEVTYLWREVQHLATLFKGATQIITYVPAHSIYGFLFTVLLPARLNIPVLHASEVQWNHLTAPGIIVATPFHWSFLLPSFNTGHVNHYAVSASSMLALQLKQQIEQKGFNLLDVYGSTETSGIGYRQKEDVYRLFPYLFFAKNGEEPLQVIDKANNKIIPLQDELICSGESGFMINSRIDSKINIAGTLVDLTEVEYLVKKIENIYYCKFTAKQSEYNTQLIAQISLLNDSAEERALCVAQIKYLLPAHETPRHFYFIPV